MVDKTAEKEKLHMMKEQLRRIPDARYIYRVTASVMTDRKSGLYRTYGIEVCENGKTVDNIPDISLDRDAVAGLVKACNRQRLDAVHLHDVVEDFLEDPYPGKR